MPTNCEGSQIPSANCPKHSKTIKGKKIAWSRSWRLLWLSLPASVRNKQHEDHEGRHGRHRDLSPSWSKYWMIQTANSIKLSYPIQLVKSCWCSWQFTHVVKDLRFHRNANCRAHLNCSRIQVHLQLTASRPNSSDIVPIHRYPAAGHKFLRIINLCTPRITTVYLYK